MRMGGGRRRWRRRERTCCMLALLWPWVLLALLLLALEGKGCLGESQRDSRDSRQK